MFRVGDKKVIHFLGKVLEVSLANVFDAKIPIWR